MDTPVPDRLRAEAGHHLLHVLHVLRLRHVAAAVGLALHPQDAAEGVARHVEHELRPLQAVVVQRLARRPRREAGTQHRAGDESHRLTSGHDVAVCEAHARPDADALRRAAREAERGRLVELQRVHAHHDLIVVVAVVAAAGVAAQLRDLRQVVDGVRAGRRAVVVVAGHVGLPRQHEHHRVARGGGSATAPVGTAATRARAGDGVVAGDQRSDLRLSERAGVDAEVEKGADVRRALVVAALTTQHGRRDVGERVLLRVGVVDDAVDVEGEQVLAVVVGKAHVEPLVGGQVGVGVAIARAALVHADDGHEVLPRVVQLQTVGAGGGEAVAREDGRVHIVALPRGDVRVHAHGQTAGLLRGGGGEGGGAVVGPAGLSPGTGGGGDGGE